MLQTGSNHENVFFKSVSALNCDVVFNPETNQHWFVKFGQPISGLNFRVISFAGWSYFCDSLISDVVLFWDGLTSGWSYFCAGFISAVVLFLRWSYFWGGLISALVLFLRWSYFWVVLFLGWSYFWAGFISAVVLFLGWS